MSLIYYILQRQDGRYLAVSPYDHSYRYRDSIPHTDNPIDAYKFTEKPFMYVPSSYDAENFDYAERWGYKYVTLTVDYTINYN